LLAQGKHTKFGKAFITCKNVETQSDSSRYIRFARSSVRMETLAFKRAHSFKKLVDPTICEKRSHFIVNRIF